MTDQKQGLNIGCGKVWENYPQFEGLDILDYGQKHVTNIFDFKTDKKYSVIMANHFLEHFSQDELKIIFNKVHDLLIRGGIFRICVPHKNKDKSYVLSHKTFWTEDSISSLTDKDFIETYGFGNWSMGYVLTNQRLDIHADLIKL